MEKLTKEDVKQLTAAALLDVVSSLVSGPIGVVLPILGNVVLNIKSTSELQEKINSLEEEQQSLIKQELEKIYDVFDKRQEEFGMEIYSIDALEIFFRAELSGDEIGIINEILKSYKNGTVEYDGEIFDGSCTTAPIDVYYIFGNSIVFNLLTDVHREDVQVLIDLINYILKDITYFNEVKKIKFY